MTAAPIPAPTISSINPTSVQVNQTTSIYVNGSNFRSGFTAQAITSGGTFPISDTQFISASQVRVGVVMGGTAPYTATLKVINPDGQSATTTFQVTTAPTSAPTISSINPTSVQVNQTTSIYVSGGNFQAGLTAQAITSGGTFPISDTQFISASQVRVGVVMGGTAPYTATLKIINPDGQFATTTFQVTAATSSTPTITSIDPTSVTVNQATSINVTGTNFRSGFTAQAITSGGTFPISDTQFISATQVRVGVVMGGTAPYTATLKIINSDGQSATTTFQVTAATSSAPTITAIDPMSVTVNQTTSIHVTGTNFRSGFTAQAITSGGTFPISDTQFISDTQVRVGLVMGGTAPYTATLKIINSDGQSATTTFQVTAATSSVPTITSISPTSVTVNQATSINVTGTNFRSGFTAQAITSGGTFPITDTQFISATQMRVGVVMGGTAPYTATLKIINPDGQTASTTFQVTAATSAPPTITAIDPTSVTVNQATSINVTGTNFRSGFTAQAITSGGTFPISDTQFISATQVRVGVVMGGTASYTATLKVINPDGQSATTTFQVTAATTAAPTISSISPTSVTANQATSIYVNGANFQSGFTAQAITSAGTFAISDRSFVSANQVRVGVVMNPSPTPPYMATLKIANPDGQSATTSFTVNIGTQQGPTITSINPTSAPASNFTLTINGTGFDGGAIEQIYYAGALVGNGAIQTRTAGQIVVTEAMATATPGAYSVKVKNSDGTLSNGVGLTINASGPASGTIKASPSSCQVPTGARNCTLSLTWSTQNVTTAQIWVTDVTGADNPVATGLSGTSTLTWIEALPQKYVFHLWDYSKGTRGAELNTVSVAATKAATGQTVGSVGVDPKNGNLGASFTVYGSGLAQGQATVWVKPPGGSPTIVGTAQASSDGGLTGVVYKSSASGTAGSYEFYAIDSAGKQTASAFLSISDPRPATTNGTSNSSGSSQDPINTATGNYVHQHTDLRLSGRGMPFVFTRFYNSQDGTPGAMGTGWSHSYSASLTVNSTDQSVTMRLPDGKIAVFDNAGGVYTSRYKSVFSKLESPSSGVFVLTTKTMTVYRFTNGRLTSISDRNNNSIQLAYSGNNLTKITDAVGRTISLGYDGGGHITSLSDPIGRTLAYEYDGAGNLIAFTDARGGRYTYTYDGADRMLAATDPEKNTFLTNTYDSSGRVSSQSDGAGNRWTYAYDTNTLTTTITDPSGKVSLHVHDANFQILRATDSFGKSEEYQYDDLGDRTSVKNRNGGTARFSYDGNGNVIAAIDPQSHLQAASYDAQNNPLSRTDAFGNTSTFTYDAHGNLVSSRNAVGNKSDLAYDTFGQLVSKTDAEGRTARYAYDTTGNLVEETDPLGNKTRYTYDPAGRRSTTTDANNFTTTLAYDANDNLASVTDPLGNKIQYAYDGNNNRIRTTDQRGKTTTFAYDANYQLLTTTDALGNNVTNAYDKLRNLVSITDQLGNVTRSSVDSENRVISSTDARGRVTRFEYDPNGNRTKVTDPLGNVTTFVYDSLNRLISVKDALGNESKTEYDEAGRVTKRTDPAGNATIFSYDPLGRQTAIQEATGGRVRFEYDKVGNRTKITDTRGKVTQFTYDGLNRVLAMTDPLGNVTKNQYDAVGSLAKLADGNGNSKTYDYDGNRRLKKVTYSTGGSVQYEYDTAGNRTRMVDLVGESTYIYDDLNRLQSYKHPTGAGLAFSFDAASDRTAIQYPGGNQVQYTYDTNRRISKVRDWNGLEVTYTYDDAGRLAGATYSNGLTSQYTYDAVGQNIRIEHRNAGGVIYSEATTWSTNGNPTSSDISGLTSSDLPSGTTANAYNDANQLASSIYGAPSYDKNGNLAVEPDFGGSATFTYDLNNRVTSIIGASVSSTMKYFGDGKIAELTTADTSRRFLVEPGMAGNRILGELDASGGLRVGYVYGPAGMQFMISDGGTYTYFHSMQGSTVSVLDAGGNVRNTYRYDPFGQKLSSSNEQVTNLFGFLGRFAVLSTGKYRLTTFRVYDSASGRFTGVDPAAGVGGTLLSPYVYADQNPTRLIDPTGLWAETLSDASQYLSTSASFAADYAGYMKALNSLASGVRLTSAEVSALKVLDWLPLVSIGLDAYKDYRDTGGDTAMVAFNVGVNSAGAAGAAAVGGEVLTVAGVSTSGSLALGAFAVGYEGGTLLYNHVAPVRNAADASVTWVGEQVAGKQGFQTWSSQESWIDYLNRPGGVSGYVFNNYVKKWF